MSTYKVPPEKVLKILAAVRPSKIFINGPVCAPIDKFAQELIAHGFNVLTQEKILNRTGCDSNECANIKFGNPTETETQKYLQSVKSFKSLEPKVVCGPHADAKIIEQLMGETFTYVYMYPSKETFASWFVESSNYGTREEELKKNTKIYKDHLEWFDHILVALY